MADTEPFDVAALTVQLLSAYLANNTVAHTDIADLVRATKAALVDNEALEPESPKAPAQPPAVTARKSLASPDHILSMIDGKPYKTLKRHLAKHGLTPQTYRERFGLPASYPMVAPGFAATRRAIAERIGLGRRPALSAGASPAPAESEPSLPEAERASTAAEDSASELLTKTTKKSAPKPRAKPGPKVGTARKPKAAETQSSVADASASAGERRTANDSIAGQKSRRTLNLFGSKQGSATALPEGATPSAHSKSAKRVKPADGA